MESRFSFISVLTVLVIFVSCVFASDSMAATIYVDDSATGSDNGGSWTDAYNSLSDALDDASDGDTILIAQGTYSPDSSGLAEPREAAFALINGVTVEGGYAGFGAADPDEQDITVYETILSGDLNADDSSGGDNSENCYHVFYHPDGTSLNLTAVLDGVTITAANANGSGNNDGAGMYNYSSSPTITDCTFSGNTADNGAGMMNDYSSPTITNCTFSGNTFGELGGGMYNNHSSPVITNCTFIGNTGRLLGGFGGYGGGMCNQSDSSPLLTNCTFSGNNADMGGGMINMSSGPTLINCTFVSNSADSAGGGISSHYTQSVVTLTNCIFWGNTSDHKNEIHHDMSATATISFCNIAGSGASGGNWDVDDSFDGGGNIDADPQFISNPNDGGDGWGDDPATTEVDESANDDYGDLHLKISSPCIDAGDNTAVAANIITDFDSRPRKIDADLDGVATVDMGAYERWSLHIYVDTNAAGANNGASWSDAFNDFQAALSFAVSGDEIWIAAGTYRPSREVGGTGSRYKTFQLKNRVSIYGGFAGTETSQDQRDIESNETILSGDLNADDASGGDNSENCYHIFYHPNGTNLDATAVLDGVTIAAANANGPGTGNFNDGAGMYNYSSSPTITNCTFSGNTASDKGAGMLNYTSSSPSLTNCTFSGNTTLNDAGGMYNHTSSSPLLINCIFSGNSSADKGGGMMNYITSSPTLINCTFGGNSADLGGGIVNYNSCNPTLTNCTFGQNLAEDHGGGMYNYDSCNPTLTNCILWGDLAITSGNEIYNNSSIPAISYCDISGSGGSAGWDTSLGSDGGGNIDTDPLFVSNPNDGGDGWGDDPATTEVDESANDDYGDLRLQTISPCIDAGDDNAVAANIITDLDFRPRKTDGDFDGVAVVDMGAYEKERLPIYVDKNADGANNGSCWSDAFNSLQDALTASLSGEEIWIAAGTYRPSIEVGGTGSRYKTFQLKNGVVIYGGFAVTETSPDQRDIQANQTILSGDLSADDASGGDNSENCYHVFYHPDGTNLNATAVLDGVTITAANANGSGYADSDGGGMYNDSSSPTITNCTFSGNMVVYWGGGMYNNGTSPTLTNCIFIGNTADVEGGGIYNDDSSSPILTNCIFSGNTAENGGGIYNYGSCTPILTNCTFDGNNAVASGGGIHNYDFCAPILTNCIFTGNTAYNGGGIANNFTSNPTLTNCILSGNTAEDGGGIYNNYSSPTLTNCTFGGNNAEYGGGIANYSSSPILTNCILWDSSEIKIYNDSSTPVISHCNISGCGGSGAGWSTYFGSDGGGNIDIDPLFVSNFDDLHLQYNSPCIDAGDNTAVAAGISTDLDNSMRIVDGDLDSVATVEMGAYERLLPIYVDANAGGANNGLRWSDAFNDLEAALSVAASGREIWIAAGTYYPSNKVGGTGSRYKTFQLKNGVIVYGGFTGTETSSDQRDIERNQTILSGDLNADDASGGSNSENCYHVFLHTDKNNLNATAILDGVTITAGNANGSDNGGGGMRNDASSPTITNCTFSGNWAEDEGGGMFNEGPHSSPTITNCIFSENTTELFGGGMANFDGSPVITNCIFVGNNSIYLEGGGMLNLNAKSTITNCTFVGNSANTGGGMCNEGADTTITNCILWGNSASYSGDDIENYGGNAIISFCNIAGSGGSGENWDVDRSFDGGGNIDADPQFVSEFDDLRLQAGSPCIDAGDNSKITEQEDLNGDPRKLNAPLTLDTGIGTGPIVDMGAYEHQPLAGDIALPYGVDLADFAVLSNQWGNTCDPSDNCNNADIDQSGQVGIEDLAKLAENWLVGI